MEKLTKLLNAINELSKNKQGIANLIQIALMCGLLYQFLELKKEFTIENLYQTKLISKVAMEYSISRKSDFELQSDSNHVRKRILIDKLIHDISINDIPYWNQQFSDVEKVLRELDPGYKFKEPPSFTRGTE